MGTNLVTCFHGLNSGLPSCRGLIAATGKRALWPPLPISDLTWVAGFASAHHPAAPAYWAVAAPAGVSVEHPFGDLGWAHFWGRYSRKSP